jgi:hypothetical protein
VSVEAKIASLYGNSNQSTTVDAFAQSFFSKSVDTVDAPAARSDEMDQMRSFLESSEQSVQVKPDNPTIKPDDNKAV